MTAAVATTATSAIRKVPVGDDILSCAACEKRSVDGEWFIKMTLIEPATLQMLCFLKHSVTITNTVYFRSGWRPSFNSGAIYERLISIIASLDRATHVKSFPWYIWARSTDDGHILCSFFTRIDFIESGNERWSWSIYKSWYTSHTILGKVPHVCVWLQWATAIRCVI